MPISSDAGPYLNPDPSRGGFDDSTLGTIISALQKAGFNVTGNDNTAKRNWINTNWSTTNSNNQSVRNVVLTVSGTVDNPANYGIFSYSNLGDLHDLPGILRSLEDILSRPGSHQTQPFPGDGATLVPQPISVPYISQDIPAASGTTTIVINVYPGGSVSSSPAAALPGQAELPGSTGRTGTPVPSTSGASQTIDAPMSQLANDLQSIKTLKEIVAKKLQQLEGLQNQIQMKMRENQDAQKKEMDERNRQKTQPQT